MIYIITTADKLLCARRELAMRKQCYPRWVEQEKMSAGQAAHQLACMESIVEHFSKLVEAESENHAATD